jgi:ParB family chromosome partitioning protein
LGRGLGALIAESSQDPGLLEVHVDDVRPNPRQPRVQIDQERLEELAASVRTHGVLQPLVVQRITEPGAPSYEVIAGERRWRAAKRAGLATIPVVVKEVDDQQRVELALVENIQRQDLNALEEAAAYRHLIEEFGLTQEVVAQRVGKARVTVANALRLLRSPAAIQDALARGDITEGHARALLSAGPEAEQLALLRRVVDGALSVRQTEELARKAAMPPAQKAEREPSELEDLLSRALSTKVVVRRSGNGGAVTIYFYSEEELDGLVMRLQGEG